MEIKIRLNGQDQVVPLGTTVAQLVADKGLNPEGVVVVVNQNIIRQEQRDQLQLQENHQVEFLSFVGGG